MRIGGQAIIEGVLMLGSKASMAVRNKDGEIVLEDLSQDTPIKGKLFKIPIVRGFASLYYSLYFGIKALNRSAELSSGEKFKKSELFWSTLFAIGLAVGLFVLLPMFITSLFQVFKHNGIIFAVVEGGFRLLLFVLYVWIISFFPDVKRLFQYHGAEHMAINAYEHGEELSVENVKKYGTIHPRCGTSFIMIFLILSIVILSLVNPLASRNFAWRLLSRILFLPVTAGFSYELLRVSAKNAKLLKVLFYPGLFFQKITTAKPDDSQIEVAITALKRVLPQTSKVEGPEYFG